MKVLVTGREGQVARSLSAARPQGDIEVIAVGRPSLDLGDASSIAAMLDLHRPDLVINAAAYTQVDNAETDEAAAFAVNAEGAGHVARACETRALPLIHVSTDYVFDGEKSHPYIETDPTGPINAYGRTKLEGERRIADTCERHLIVRTSSVYSPLGSNFMLTMLRLATSRPTLSVVADQRSCPTYAPHLAVALLDLAQRAVNDRNSTPWGIYNAAGQGETSWFGFASEIFRQAALQALPVAAVTPIAAIDYPTPAKRPLNSRLDGARLLATFGVGLPHWHEGVRECLSSRSLQAVA